MAYAQEVALPDAFAQVLLNTAEALETDAVHLPSMLSADLDDMPKGALSGLGHKQDVALTVEEAEAHEEVALLPAKTSIQDQVGSWPAVEPIIHAFHVLAEPYVNDITPRSI